jgi:hypothetical protein
MHLPLGLSSFLKAACPHCVVPEHLSRPDTLPTPSASRWRHLSTSFTKRGAVTTLRWSRRLFVTPFGESTRRRFVSLGVAGTCMRPCGGGEWTISGSHSGAAASIATARPIRCLLCSAVREITPNFTLLPCYQTSHRRHLLSPSAALLLDQLLYSARESSAVPFPQ